MSLRVVLALQWVQGTDVRGGMEEAYQGKGKLRSRKGSLTTGVGDDLDGRGRW